jgi:hypothetical protein
VYLRARWYDAGEGRFGSRDPFQGWAEQPASLHTYAYTENDPINAIDPTGLARYRIWTSAFIQPASLQFFYQEGKFFSGLWEGDNRGFYDLAGSRPSARIWAEVTIDTGSTSGYIAGTDVSGVGLTVVHYVDWSGNIQTDRKRAIDEAVIQVARDGNYILARIQNRGPNPLTPPGTPPIIYDYNLVVDMDEQRLVVGGDTGVFPSHEIVIEGVGFRGSHPNYSGGTNPLALTIPAVTFDPIVVNLSDGDSMVCPERNPASWSVLDKRYILEYLPRLFPETPWEP